MNWVVRSPEEQNLFNPSFCSILLWNASVGYRTIIQDAPGLPFALSFLILPAVLRQSTRETLPRSISTSVPVWLDDHPLERSQIALGARSLQPFTREAILFGATHNLLTVDAAFVRPQMDKRKAVATMLNGCTEEVQQCASKAHFFGRWVGQSGSTETTMALFGVKL